MSASSDLSQSMTRKSSQALLRSLARLPLEQLAAALAKDESTASRVRSGEARVTLLEFCELVDVAGLKLVSTDKVCVDRQKFEALATLAAAAMSDKDAVRKLIWDEE